MVKFLLLLSFVFFTGMAEDDKRQAEDLLGHNVYATPLAELLCEPSLELPVNVGVYSRWGSSKVHFFKRLQRKFDMHFD